MISLLHLNKFILFVLFLIIVNLKPAFGEDEPIDIWEKKDDEQEEKNEDDNKKKIIKFDV